MVDNPVEPLKAAVRALHAAGFVHGDLRGCSTLVAASAVYLIDFEWPDLQMQWKSALLETYKQCKATLQLVLDSEAAHWTYVRRPVTD